VSSTRTFVGLEPNDPYRLDLLISEAHQMLRTSMCYLTTGFCLFRAPLVSEALLGLKEAMKIFFGFGDDVYE